MSQSQRHSPENRKPTAAAEAAARHRHGDPHPAAHLTEDDAEQLAEKIIAAGSDYMSHKTEERFTEDEVPQGASALVGADPAAVANKILKEGAREMERQEGHVHAGSPAAMAQSVYQHKDNLSAPQHKVAEKVRERVAAVEEHAARETFVGVNPDAGGHDTKLRHLSGSPRGAYVTASMRGEGNPDVVKEK